MKLYKKYITWYNQGIKLQKNFVIMNFLKKNHKMNIFN